MDKLTDKQHRIYLYLKDFISKNSYPPSLRELAAHFKFKSINSVTKYLKILEDKGYINRRANSSRALELVHSPLAATKMVPVVGIIRAGMPVLSEENIDSHLAMDASMVPDDDSFFLKVQGDSMIDAHIQEGDFALIRQQRNAENGQIVAALVNDEATLKYLYRHEDYFELRPANRAYAPIVVSNRDRLYVIGRLVTIVRRYAG